MKKKKLIIVSLLLIIIQSTMVLADNSAVVERSKEYSQSATYDIPITTNEIEEWPQGPAILCDAAVLMETDTQTVLYNKAMDERRYPASTTKIMTVLVALENSNLSDQVTFTAEGLREAVPGNSYVTPNLQVGEVLTMEQCLYAIMLISGNEVSTQVAEHIAGSVEAFCQLMNKKAEEVGCRDTHFMNANGLHDENHYTTAHDLALIAKAAYENEVFRTIVGTKSYTIPATNMTSQPRELVNHHALLVDGEWHYEGCLGGKTGYTDAALNTLVTYIEKDKEIYVCVVLHFEGIQVFTDTVLLAEYAGEFNKVQIIPEEFTKFGGNAIIPKGKSADTVDISRSGNGESSHEKEIFYYHGYQVGSGIVDENAIFLQKKQEEEAQNIKKPNVAAMEQAKENGKMEGHINDKFFMITIIVLICLIVLGILGICLSSYEKHRRNKRKRKR